MTDSSNRALFFWKKDTLNHGDRNIIGPYLQDLSRRLRDNPTREECEAAAQVFDRIVMKGHAAWKACGFIAANRPAQFRRDYAIWVAVRDLVVFRKVASGQAYARVASRHRLSASRVKNIYLGFERARQKSRRDVAD